MLQLWRKVLGRNPTLLFSKSLHCFIRVSRYYRKSRIMALLCQGLLSRIVGSILVKITQHISKASLGDLVKMSFTVTDRETYSFHKGGRN